jgi:protein-disulfide isomerase
MIRTCVGVMAVVGMALSLPAMAATPAGEAMSLGDPHAPVTVVEYASVGCPHCATWANNVFPEFRNRYIDTGKVRFEFHEMLTGNSTLAAVGFMIARCASPTKYFQVVDDVFARQAEIGEKGIAVLEEIGEHAGLTRPEFDACLHDQSALDELQKRTIADATAHGVTGTPTFFVGGEKLDGEQPLEALAAAVARARR